MGVLRSILNILVPGNIDKEDSPSLPEKRWEDIEEFIKGICNICQILGPIKQGFVPSYALNHMCIPVRDEYTGTVQWSLCQTCYNLGWTPPEKYRYGFAYHNRKSGTVYTVK